MSEITLNQLYDLTILEYESCFEVCVYYMPMDIHETQEFTYDIDQEEAINQVYDIIQGKLKKVLH